MMERRGDGLHDKFHAPRGSRWLGSLSGRRKRPRNFEAFSTLAGFHRRGQSSRYLLGLYVPVEVDIVVVVVVDIVVVVVVEVGVVVGVPVGVPVGVVVPVGVPVGVPVEVEVGVVV